MSHAVALPARAEPSGRDAAPYVQPTLDIANLDDRGTVIHELQHVLKDARAPAGPPQLADRGDAELEAYVAEADYGRRSPLHGHAGARARRRGQDPSPRRLLRDGQRRQRLDAVRPRRRGGRLRDRAPRGARRGRRPAGRPDQVDAVPSTYMPNHWEAMYAAVGATTKGDTVYLPLLLDPATLVGQGTVVHELTHAAGDKAAKPGSEYPRARSELESYGREARFYLDAIGKLRDAARAEAIQDLGATLKDFQVHALILEANTAAVEDWDPIADTVRELDAVLFPLTRADVERGLNRNTKEDNERAALKAIVKAYQLAPGAKTSRDGLRGESALDS